MVEARAFWVERAGLGAIRSETLPTLAGNQLLVRSIVSGVSRGTESIVFQGRVPESQHATMRAPFQEGAFPGPVKYGYASVGIVEAGPAEWVGQRVFCLYPHQDRYIVPIEAVTPIPDAVPSARAVLAANLETAVNGLWDGAPGIGDRISVVGCGTVGGLVAALAARIPGSRVEIVDVMPERAALARSIGARFASPDTAADDADLVFHASGTAQGLATALRLAAFEATVVELSWHGDASVPLPLGEAFHSRRITVRSSQVGAVPPERRARWSNRRRLELALALLADPLFDSFLTGESAFDELPRLLPRLAQDPGSTLCHVIRYPQCSA